MDTKRIDPFIAKHKSLRKKNATTILAIAANIREATYDLSGREQEKFFTEIGMQREGATHKKFRKIDERASRFEPYLDTLTGCWTTLWELAKLEDHEFERVANANMLQETWSEISKLLRPSSPTKTSDRLPITIDLKHVKIAQRRSFIASLRKLLSEYEVKPSDATTAVLEKCFGDNEEQKQAA